MNDRLAELLARKLSGEASPSELQELEDYLQNHPADQYFTDLLSSYWDNFPGKQTVKNIQAEELFRNIMARADGHPEIINPPGTNHGNMRWFWRLAAAVILIVIVGGGYWMFFSFEKKKKDVIVPVKNEIESKRGMRSQVYLPDGSLVRMNSESKIYYTGLFNDSIREVELEGEAYFDVVKDTKRPFIVKTSGISVRALGTAFSIKSYPLESTIETVLISGAVEITKNNEPGAKTILHPHEKLVYNKEQGKNVELPQTKRVDTSRQSELMPHGMAVIKLPGNIPDSSLTETSFAYDKLLFDGDSFAELAAKMERWFNVKIKFLDERVSGYRFHGVFEKETLAEALEALELIRSFTYKINGDEVEIDKK